MTNLEHLIENGLEAIKTLEREDWLRFMVKDINLQETDIMLSDLWEICQYVQYSYIPATDQLIRCKDCKHFKSPRPQCNHCITKRGDNCGWCNMTGWCVDETDYCSKGRQDV